VGLDALEREKVTLLTGFPEGLGLFPEVVMTTPFPSQWLDCV